jgi:DNA-binding MarR family transcriptional regulator
VLGVAFPFPLPLSSLLGRVQAAFAAEFDERLAGVGMGDLSLSLGSNVLRHLEEDRGVRLGVLAEMAGVTKQAISQQVTDLERRGYVVVEPDPADHRAKSVRLTDKGRESQRVGRPLFGKLEKDWQQRYGTDDVRELRRILEAILEQRDDTGVVPRDRTGGGRSAG